MGVLETAALHFTFSPGKVSGAGSRAGLAEVQLLLGSFAQADTSFPTEAKQVTALQYLESRSALVTKSLANSRLLRSYSS